MLTIVWAILALWFFATGLMKFALSGSAVYRIFLAIVFALGAFYFYH